MKNRYIKAVKRNISPFCKERKQYLQHLDNDLTAFINENPDITYDGLCELFGDPIINAEMFMESLSEDARIKIKNRKRISIIVIAILVVILAIAVISKIIPTESPDKSFDKPDEEIHIKDVPIEDMDKALESVKNGEYKNE